MLDTILQEIQTALETNETIEIDASPNRFGFVKDGLNYPRGLHGFREWWALENCMRMIWMAGFCDYNYTNFHTLHVIPRKGKRRRGLLDD